MPSNLTPPTSLRERLAQLLVVRIGSNLPPIRTVEEDAERIGQLLQTCPIGGLIAFNGRRDQTPATLEKLQSLSALPLLVSADIERGVGQQLHGPELFPHAMAFDALGDSAAETVEEFARLTAIDARKSGVQIAFAPVADVNIDPRNPIIATRAFGSDPQRVAQLVSAFIRGCNKGGLLSTAKHFPGHGNTHEDSHHALPTVIGDQQQLESCELVPFRAAIEAGVPLIMSAHVCYPAWDDSGSPATLSQAILIDLLREQMGFQGAVVSDSLLMEGVKSRCSTEGELAVQTLLAGVDILLDVAEPASTLAALEDAVDKGELPEQRVDEAFGRLWQLKRQAFETDPIEQSDEVAQQTELLISQTAKQAISITSHADNFQKFNPNKSLCVVLVRPYESHLDPPQQPLGAAISRHSPDSEYLELGPRSEQQDFQNALSQAAKAEQLLVAIIVKPAAWHVFGLLPEQQKFAEQLIQQQPCVLASLGTPEALDKFEDTVVKLCTFSDVPASQRALADYLFD